MKRRSNRLRNTFYRRVFKRLLGFFAALLGLIILSPVMLIIIIAINIDSRGGSIFKQRRLGRDAKEFTVYKFRTMVKDAYKIGGPTSYEGDPRITTVGAFLRRTSLDELPQLINIIMGQMCFIGPRPILKEEFEPYINNQRYCKRYSVSPGLFCTVDVEYRATASRELQMEMDADYVERISFGLDMKTLLGVFVLVVQQKNVYNSTRHSRGESK